MIREATTEDIPRIVEMGSRSLREGSYRGMIADNPDQTAAFALQVISKSGKVLLAVEEMEVTGLIGYILFPHYFSGELTAGEVMWYVEPEHRASFTALALLRAAESCAKKAGAVRMQFTAPTQEVGRAYERMGYKQVEVTYQRTL